MPLGHASPTFTKMFRVSSLDGEGLCFYLYVRCCVVCFFLCPNAVSIAERRREARPGVCLCLCLCTVCPQARRGGEGEDAENFSFWGFCTQNSVKRRPYLCAVDWGYTLLAKRVWCSCFKLVISSNDIQEMAWVYLLSASRHSVLQVIYIPGVRS